MTDADAWGSELASWAPLTGLLVGYGVIVAALVAFGRGHPLERIPDALRRLTGMPGWAGASAGTAMYGLLVAGQGFYSDVAWHVALGRDKELFTAPHASIVVGLAMIFLSAALGIVAATVERVPTRLRLGALRVPWSMLPLAALGGAAVGGFPLDEVWHRAYGVDVTMWSPTHMLMILGASFAGAAVWLVLAEAGVSPGDSAWAKGAHVLAGTLTLLGLTAPQGEFDFGVPQFQQMFHPLLVTVAAGFGLVAIRLVLGPWRAVGIAGVLFLVQQSHVLADEPVDQAAAHLYVVSAAVVEAVAWLAGTRRRLRFALLSGAGVATLGLAGEWVWNQRARQPWRTSLLPDAALLALVVGLGAAVVGTAFATAILRAGGPGGGGGGGGGGDGPGVRPVPGLAVALGAAAVVVGLALPLPRGVGDVTADVQVERTAGGDEARVRARLDPAGAADEARWFQVVGWQGGGLVVADMELSRPGEYVSDRAVPVTGRWKALLRLHRGGELMAAPVRFPADPEVDAEAIPAADRRVTMTGERRFLLQEAQPGTGALAYAVHALLALVATAWAATFVLAVARLRRDGPGDRGDPEDAAERAPERGTVPFARPGAG